MKKLILMIAMLAITGFADAGSRIVRNKTNKRVKLRFFSTQGGNPFKQRTAWRTVGANSDKKLKFTGQLSSVNVMREGKSTAYITGSNVNNKTFTIYPDSIAYSN